MSGTDIFLSYARHDRVTARIFAESLANEGLSVWWDASLHSGETFDEVIEQKLRDAKAVVVLWSPRSVASRWVRAEATLADRRKKLAPAIIEPCDRPIIFELTHAADLCEWTGDVTDIRWRTFVEDLRHLIAARSADSEAAHGQPAAAREPAPARSAVSPTPPPHAQGPIRQPLRPGSDEVIFVNAVRRPAGVQSEPEPVANDLPEADVHCLEPEDSELMEGPVMIDSAGVKLGRSAPADIVITHKSVSREHCIIGLANDELLVTDLNSTNGTYVDEERISRATILPVGSVLRVGQVAFRHAIRSPEEVPLRSGQGSGDGRVQGPRFAATS